MNVPALDNLVRLLSSLPGVGQRSALRIAFHLLKGDDFQSRQLGQAILDLRQKLRFCHICGALSETEVCSICQDDDRETTLLCVVEEPGDIYAIERTAVYKGKYHVLMGALSPLDGVGPEDLRLKELQQRVQNTDIQELFIATNPTLEGDATARYIQGLFPSLRCSRISHGIPTGASIEFADTAALTQSIRNRQIL